MDVIYNSDPRYADLGMASRVLLIIKIVSYVIAAAILIGFIIRYYCKKKKCSTDEALIKLRKETCKSIVPLLIVLFLIIFAPIVVSWTFTKPIIYIYPEEEMNLQVTLKYPERITCSYPNYFSNDGWNVKAFPNGDLVDLNSGRRLYSLYWEGEFKDLDRSMDEGFCVKGEDSAKFLEEKLDMLGLNYKEAEEFIVYWLPKLESNKYNFIRFVTTEEFNRYMPLILKDSNEETITVDTLIRVLMVYKPLNHQIDVEEQVINSPVRQGFTVVEWGGTKI